MTKSTIRTIALFPLKRPGFSLLCLLCIETVVIWIATSETVWSKAWFDQDPATGTTMVCLSIGRGQVSVVWAGARPERPREGDGWMIRIDWLICVGTVGSGDSQPCHVAGVNLWLIALLFAAYPLFASYRLYRNRRAAPQVQQ